MLNLTLLSTDQETSNSNCLGKIRCVDQNHIFLRPEKNVKQKRAL